MTDLETRLRSVLSERAESAPAAVDLVQEARGRLARRRRSAWRGAGVVCVVAVAAIALAAALRAPAPPSESTSPGPDAPPVAVAVPPGWHTETWRDVEIQVPDGWSYGRVADSCTDVGHGAPVVERPTERMSSGRCGPAPSGYGVQFLAADGPGVGDVGVAHLYASGSGPQLFPEGAWVGVADVGGEAVIKVATRSERVADQVLGSARRITDLDSNGCEPTADLAMGDGVPVLGAIVTVSAVSVCGYDVLAGPATVEPLAWSTRLTGAPAQVMLEALKSAALHGNASARRCLTDPLGPAYLLRFGSARVWVRPVGSCPPRGAVVDGTQTRLLTPQILSLVTGLAPAPTAP